jgi:hypothetical protein
MSCEPMQELSDFVEGDQLPELLCEFQDVDITGYEFELHIAYRPDALVKAGEIVDAEAGTFKFTWDDGDLVAGRDLAEIQVTLPSSKPISFQFWMKIAKQIA